MSIVINRAQAIVLGDIVDWTAPFEVAQKRGYKNPGMASGAYGKMLASLYRLGLADWHQPNNTYRINDAGRAALAADAGRGKGER